MATVEYIVEWTTNVDHPELRDESFARLPRHVVSDRKIFVGTKARARALAWRDELLSGEYDFDSEYISRVRVIRLGAHSRGRRPWVRIGKHMERLGRDEPWREGYMLNVNPSRTWKPAIPPSSGPRYGYAYVFTGSNWKTSSDEQWDTDVAIGHGMTRRGFVYQGTRRIDGSLVDVWKSQGIYYAQTAIGRANANPTALLANPLSTTALLAIAGVAAVGLWFIFKPKKAEAKELPPGGPAVCPFDVALLDAWADARGYDGAYFPNASSADAYTNQALQDTLNAMAISAPNVVVVLNDQSFWLFTGGVLAPAPAQKDDYCAWTAQQPQTGTPPPQNTPVTCPFDLTLLNAWANVRGYALFYFGTTTPPTWDYLLKNALGFQQALLQAHPILVVLSDQTFWEPTGTPPVLVNTTALKDDYCAWAAQQPQAA